MRAGILVRHIFVTQARPLENGIVMANRIPAELPRERVTEDSISIKVVRQCRMRILEVLNWQSR